MCKRPPVYNPYELIVLIEVRLNKSKPLIQMYYLGKYFVEDDEPKGRLWGKYRFWNIGIFEPYSI